MSQPKTIRVATRRSPLALWQADWVAKRLAELGIACQLVPLVSQGDDDQRPITTASGVGLFTKRIQQALIDGEADVAVHSLKDLPTMPIDALQVSAVSQRAEVEDCLLTATGLTLDELPRGAGVGTSSRRRAAQLLAYRDDLRIAPIRGNVQTRIDQVMCGDFDATLLAAAGLARLDMHDLPMVKLPLEVMLPAPGQAALAVETRRDDEATSRIVARLNHGPTRRAVTAERRLLSDLSGGCLAPIAALATVQGEQLALRAVVLSPDGKQRLVAEVDGPADQPDAVGSEAAKRLRGDGAEAIIAAAR